MLSAEFTPDRLFPSAKTHTAHIAIVIGMLFE